MIHLCLTCLQGEYLGDLLSYTNGEIVKQTTQELKASKLKPFKYRHLGSFAYVGDNRAVLQLPIIGMLYVHVHVLDRCKTHFRRVLKQDTEHNNCNSSLVLGLLFIFALLRCCSPLYNAILLSLKRDGQHV